jgi:hypothetical protein
MRRTSPLLRFCGLLLALSLAACAAYQAQHGAPSAAAPAGHDEAMAVIKATGEFCEMPADRQAARIRGEVEHTKEELASQGRYDCCVAPACTECLMHHGECHCRDVVRKSGPCCGECTQAWIEGKGTVEGVNAWDLLERKKAMLKDTGKPGGGGNAPHSH